MTELERRRECWKGGCDAVLLLYVLSADCGYMSIFRSILFCFVLQKANGKRKLKLSFLFRRNFGCIVLDQNMNIVSTLVRWVCSSMYISLSVILPVSCALGTKTLRLPGGGREGGAGAHWNYHKRTRNLTCRPHTFSVWVPRYAGVWGHVGRSVRVPGRGSARRRHRSQERPDVHRQADRGERYEPKTKTRKCTGIIFLTLRYSYSCV